MAKNHLKQEMSMAQTKAQSEALAKAHAGETSTQQALLSAINQKMPFGKYAGRRLLELPEPYLVWFHGQGFPEGRLGEQLALIYEVKLNGLESMLRPLLR
jgi:uncharacterized protein